VGQYEESLAAFKKFFCKPVYLHHALKIHVGVRLVKNNDLRVHSQNPGNGEAAFFPA